MPRGCRVLCALTAAAAALTGLIFPKANKIEGEETPRSGKSPGLKSQDASTFLSTVLLILGSV